MAWVLPRENARFADVLARFPRQLHLVLLVLTPRPPSSMLIINVAFHERRHLAALGTAALAHPRLVHLAIPVVSQKRPHRTSTCHCCTSARQHPHRESFLPSQEWARRRSCRHCPSPTSRREQSGTRRRMLSTHIDSHSCTKTLAQMYVMACLGPDTPHLDAIAIDQENLAYSQTKKPTEPNQPQILHFPWGRPRRPASQSQSAEARKPAIQKRQSVESWSVDSTLVPRPPRIWGRWNFGTKKPRNQETKKPSNCEANKLWNQESKKPVRCTHHDRWAMISLFFDFYQISCRYFPRFFVLQKADVLEFLWFALTFLGNCSNWSCFFVDYSLAFPIHCVLCFFLN